MVMGRSSVVTFKSKQAQLCRRGDAPLLDSLRFKIGLIFHKLSISMLLLGGLSLFRHPEHHKERNFLLLERSHYFNLFDSLTQLDLQKIKIRKHIFPLNWNNLRSRLTPFLI